MKYKILSGKQVRIRESDAVTSLAVGTLASGEVFDALMLRGQS